MLGNLASMYERLVFTEQNGMQQDFLNSFITEIIFTD